MEPRPRTVLYGETVEVAVAVAVAEAVEVSVAVADVLSRVVFGVVFSGGGVVRVVRSVSSGNAAPGGSATRGRYTKKKSPALMARTSTSVTRAVSHLLSMSKNLTFGKIAKGRSTKHYHRHSGERHNCDYFPPHVKSHPLSLDES